MDNIFPTEAEAATLGGIITKNSLLHEVNLTPEDFYLPAHKAVFQAMLDLDVGKRPIDELTLEHALSTPDFAYEGSRVVPATTFEKVGGVAFVAQLALRCPTSDNTLAYADIVREAASLRRLRHTLGDAAELIAGGRSSGDVRALLEQRLVGESPDVRGSTLADVETVAVRGLDTGLGIERYVPGGIPCDKITTIFAESGHGKSTLKNAIMFRLAATGHRVLDVSLEDSASLTVARYLAQKHKVPYGELAAGSRSVPGLDGSDRDVLGLIVDGSRTKPRMAELLRLAKKEKVAAVFVDYVQLLEGCSGDHAMLAEAIRDAQLFAKDEGIAVVLVSQVKQDVNYRALQRDTQGRLVGDPRPSLSDCLGSSALRTHTKLGIGMFWPWKYRPAPTTETGPYGAYAKWINEHVGGVEYAMEVYPSIAEVIVDKNVLGPSKVHVNVRVDWPTGHVVPFEL